MHTVQTAKPHMRSAATNTHFVQLLQGKLNSASIALAASPHRLLVWHHYAQRDNQPTTRSDSLPIEASHPKPKQALTEQTPPPTERLATTATRRLPTHDVLESPAAAVSMPLLRSFIETRALCRVLLSAHRALLLRELPRGGALAVCGFFLVGC